MATTTAIVTTYQCAYCKQDRPLTADHWPQRMLDVLEWHGGDPRKAEKDILGFSPRSRKAGYARCYTCYTETITRNFARRFWHHARIEGELFNVIENWVRYSHKSDVEDRWNRRHYHDTDQNIWADQIAEKFRNDIESNGVTVDDDWEQYLPDFMRLYPTGWLVPTGGTDRYGDPEWECVHPRALIMGLGGLYGREKPSMDWDSTWTAPVTNPALLIETGLFPETLEGFLRPCATSHSGYYSDSYVDKVKELTDKWEIERRIQSLTPKEVKMKAERIARLDGGKYTPEYRGLIQLHGQLRRMIDIAVDVGRKGVQTFTYNPTVMDEYDSPSTGKHSFHNAWEDARELANLLLIDISATVALGVGCAENLDARADSVSGYEIKWGFLDYVMDNWVDAEPNSRFNWLPQVAYSDHAREEAKELFEAVADGFDAKQKADSEAA
jgi:hypothetical protein